jgi:tRNA pseudouridine38-40 synthase
MIALGLEYLGAHYQGWQRQTPSGSADASTIQGCLESALSIVADSPVSVVAAGRTDTGVHASLQIAHFAPAVARPLTAWVRGVNAHLPNDIAIRWATPVADTFHARFSAISRRYTYWLTDRSSRPGLLSDRIGWFHLPLEVSSMQTAAACLVGEHDFSSFRSSECQAKSPVKRVHAIAVQRIGAHIRVDFHADAFLHHMVRNIIGALVYVGAGKVPTAQMREWLNARDRTYAPPTFSPAGLYLVGIEYPRVFALPEQHVEVRL